jgi:branched-chain amino acid transport system substrate-binding protein
MYFESIRSLHKITACLVMITLCSALSTTSCKADDKQPIKIGFVASLTGPAANTCQSMLNGIKLSLEQVNYNVAGHKIEVIVENDGGNPATAREKIKKLVEVDKVNILDGFVLANIGYAAAPTIEKYQIPTIFAVAASDDLTQREHFNWLVRTGWSSSLPSHPFGDWVYKNLHYKRIVCVGMDYSFGWEVVGGFQQSFEDAGGKVIQKIWAPLGFTDFTAFIKQIRPDADALFLLTSNKAAEVFPQQYAKSGLKLPIVAGGTSYDETVLPMQGDESVGAINVHIYSPTLNTPANTKFVKAFQLAYKVEPGVFAELGYTSGKWIVKAIENLKGDVSNKTKLLAALKSVQLVDDPRGPISLDDRANPIENVYVRKVTRVNGKLQNVVIDTFPNVGQFWKYKPEQYLKQPRYSKDYPPVKPDGPAK